MPGPACGNNPHHQPTDGDRQAVDLARAYLIARAELSVAAHRLEQIRDAVRLHRQQLIGTYELYAVIEAAEDDGVQPPADRAAVLREAAGRLAELRAAEREWLPATGLHKGEQELRRMADETAAAETQTNACPPGCVACATDESHDPAPAAGARQDEAQQAARPAPAADEDAQRTARRRSLRVLINRVNNGVVLAPDEAQLLARHVATEICDANTARTATAELAEAQAAIERVRGAAKWIRRNYPGISHVHERLAAALDGTEQPTTET
ncbi:hypothetical protein [Streptomyces sp. NPDC056160]|uniref:hypothetical protein n=1 Tax=Streptomyces sp. NPDC056160 TaxID=3345731 RepID=UPI0035E1CDFB